MYRKQNSQDCANERPIEDMLRKLRAYCKYRRNANQIERIWLQPSQAIRERSIDARMAIMRKLLLKFGQTKKRQDRHASKIKIYEHDNKA